jgi:hypothetical protein
VGKQKSFMSAVATLQLEECTSVDAYPQLLNEMLLRRCIPAFPQSIAEVLTKKVAELRLQTF